MGPRASAQDLRSANLMSRVTDIILITAIDDGASTDQEHPNVDQLNDYLKSQHGGCSLVQVDHRAGGSKAMQCDVFMAAINYLDHGALLAHLEAISWETPECVQLMLKGEEEDRFSIFRPPA